MILAILLIMLGIALIYMIPTIFVLTMIPASLSQSCLGLLVGILAFGFYLGAIAICFAQAVRLLIQ